MPYVTPVTDRAASDIANRTNKGFFNVADWTRIYGNAEYLNGVLQTALGLNILFHPVATPTVTTIPTVTDLNFLLANIEQIRLASGVSGTTEIQSNWIAGILETAPNYRNVNLWESTMNIIYNAYLGSPVRYGRTGIATTGRALTKNNSWRHY